MAWSGKVHPKTAQEHLANIILVPWSPLGDSVRPKVPVWEYTSAEKLSSIREGG